MLPKTNRLTKAQFDQAFTTGRRNNGTYCTVIFVPGPTFHCAVVVSKKVCKKAVLRNRWRRRVYGVVESIVATESPALGTYLVMVKPSVITLTKLHFTTTLKTELGRAMGIRVQ